MAGVVHEGGVCIIDDLESVAISVDDAAGGCPGVGAGVLDAGCAFILGKCFWMRGGERGTNKRL